MAYCLNVLWRVCEKRGTKTRAEHRSKPQLAAEMVQKVADWLPQYKLHVVADVAYLGQALLKNRADNVELIGPLRWDAVLTEPLPPSAKRRRKRGDRLPALKEHKPAVTFADMLATCRYNLWRHWLAKSASPAELAERQAWLLEYLATAA